jgi:hypothetical protein
MTNKQLRGWYTKYNKLYFGGQLPKIYVRFAKMPKDTFGFSTYIGDWVGIELNRTYKHWLKFSRCVLLHEMVHISLPKKIMHGPRFEKGMQRLAKLGAFMGIW